MSGSVFWRVWVSGVLVWVLAAVAVIVIVPQPVEASLPLGGNVQSLALARFGNGGVLPAVEDGDTGSEGLDSIQLDMLDRVKQKADKSVLKPGFDVWPGFDQLQIVGLDSWFAVDDDAWVGVEVEEKLGDGEGFVGVDKIVASADEPERVEYEFEDGVKFCRQQGVPYSESADKGLSCRRGWDHTSEVFDQRVRARLIYEFDWVLSGAAGEENAASSGSGSFVISGEWSEWRDLTIGEVGTVVSDGTAAAQVRVDRGDAVASVDPESEGGCRWGFLCDIGRAGVAAWEWGQGAWDSLSSGLLTYAKFMFSITKGCLGNVVDLLVSLKDMVVQAYDFYRDPVAYVEEQMEMIKTTYQAAKDDPEEFVKELLGAAFEQDLWEESKGEWLGKFGCQLIAAVFTGGASATTGVLKSFKTVDKLLDAINAIRKSKNLSKIDNIAPGNRKKDRSDGRDDEDRPDDSSCDLASGTCVPCKKSSFPTGTQVRTASGLTPIEKITPGTRVLAADPVSGVWSNEVVLDQWSHVDDGRLATAVLVDGSEITATDDHLFWVDSDGAWVELEDVGPGDSLLTPDGVATVSHVVLWPQANQLVWELDTAGPDTFTVWTGTEDILVHNQEDACRPKSDKDSLDDDPKFKDGLSPREIVALERFLGLRLKLLNKWHGYDFDALFPGDEFAGLRRRLKASRNSVDGDFDASDVAGRTKESRGEATPADHIGSTNRGVTSVENTIKSIDEALDSGGLSADQRAMLQEMRSDLDGIKTEMIDATAPRP